MADSAGPRRSPAATAAPCSSRSGAPTASSISSGTRPGGASSIAGRTTRLCAFTVRAARSWRGRNGCSARAAMRCTPTARSAWCRCGAACRCSRCGDLKGGKVTQYAQLQNRTARIDDPVAFASGFAALDRPADCGAGDHAHGKGRPCPRCRRRSPVEVAPGFISKGEVREFRRPDGQTVYGDLLRAEERHAPRSGRGRPAGARPRARRPHVHDRCRPEDAHPVLHEPRFRRARRQLFGQHRLRPRLPPAPRRRLGHRRCRRLRGGRAASGQGRPRRRAPHRHRRRQRRRLHHADGARHDEGVRRRQQPLRRVGFGPAARAYAQVRIGLSAPPDGDHAGTSGRTCSRHARPSI